jgi:hypothetical protein
LFGIRPLLLGRRSELARCAGFRRLSELGLGWRAARRSDGWREPERRQLRLDGRRAAPTECPSPDLVYASVEPILRERCVVCHAGLPGGPWPLDTYGHVATWRDTIRAALLACAMPPSDSGMSIPPEESQRILEWIRCGMPP